MRRRLIVLLLAAWLAPSGSAAAEKTPPPPLTLARAVRLALQNGEAAAIAAKDLEAARLEKRKAWGAVAPEVSFSSSWDYSRNQAYRGQPADEGDSFTAGFGLNQPLYTGGRAFSALRSSDSAIAIGGHGLELAREGIFLATTEAFLDALTARRLIEAGEQAVEQAKRFDQLSTLRFELGEVTRTDVLRAQFDLSRRENELVLARNDLALARDTLARLVGGPVGEVSEEAIELDAPVAEDLDALITRAMAARRELLISDRRVAIAGEGVVSARGRFLPLVYVNGYYLQQGPEFAPDDAEKWGASLLVDVPIYDRGISAADLRLARNALEKSELERERIRKDIALQVREAYYSLRGLASSVESLRAQVALAEENSRGVGKQYEVGLATDLAVSAALTDLLQAKVALARAENGLILAGLRLQQAVGTLRVPE